MAALVCGATGQSQYRPGGGGDSFAAAPGGRPGSGGGSTGGFGGGNAGFGGGNGAGNGGANGGFGGGNGGGNGANDGSNGGGSLEDAIPGVPGDDYPIFAEVPETSFICDGQVHYRVLRNILTM